MRVVFLEDVAGVAQGGEVKEVKNGFARNYLIPKNLAVVATQDTMQRVQRLGKHAEETRLQKLTDMKALGEELDGVQIDIAMRAGASGRLYGSVTNVVVAEELAKLTAREIDRRTIEIPESIRQVGLHQVRIRLHADVDANITLRVYPEGTDPAEFVPPEVPEEDEAAEEVTFDEAIEAELAADEDEAAAETKGDEAEAPEAGATVEAAEADAEEKPAAEADADESTEPEPAEDEPAEAEADEGEDGGSTGSPRTDQAEDSADEEAVAEAEADDEASKDG